MTNRPICPQGQRKPDSPCIFCGDGSYCAHQYYCPETRRYENTRWRECRKVPHPSEAETKEPRGGAEAAPYEGFFIGAAESSGPSTGYNDPLRAAGPTNEQEGKKIEAKKSNRRKPRKG